jgi:hypothetical protein
LGLVLIRHFFETVHHATVEDVHRESRDIDLVLTMADRKVFADVKVDFYFGAEERTDFHRRRTNHAALETVSSDSTGTMGWMVTSASDYIFYYFLALDNPPDEIRRWIEEEDEAACLREARVFDDCLVLLPTAALQRWFWQDKRYTKYRHCRIPNLDQGGKTYNTWVRLVPVSDLLAIPDVRIYDRIWRNRA